jgi:hypothetical protein
MHALQVSRKAFVPAADLNSNTAPLRDTAYLRARGQTSIIGKCHTLPCVCTRDIAGLCRILTRLLLRAGQEILREPAAWCKEEVLYRTGCWGGGMGEDWEPNELGGSHVARKLPVFEADTRTFGTKQVSLDPTAQCLGLGCTALSDFGS